MRQRSTKFSRQRGYALLMVVFMTTALLIAAVMVAPSILVEGKREKEEEMIWRGKQYVRAVKMYFRKSGHFPTSLDDLTKPKIGSIRLMRQPYKDPMNKEDGSWRLIYINPVTGQLIGSLKPPRQDTPLAPPPPPFGTSAASMGTLASSGMGNLGVSPGGAQSPFGGSSSGFGQQTPSSPQSGVGTGPATNGTSNGAGTSGAGQAAASGDQATSSGNPPTIIGGSIIGVGSTVDQPSIKYYDGAKKYLLFEFIWDPSRDVMRFGQNNPPIGTPIGQPGQGTSGQPQGQNPFAPQNPQQPQNPPQQQ